MRHSLPTRATAAATAAVVALAVLPAAPALADDDADVPHRGPCRMHVKASYRAEAVVARGLPLKVTCGAPATFFAGLDFEDRHSGDWIVERFGSSGDPGAEAHHGSPVTMRAAGTRTVHLAFRPWARRMIRDIPRITMHLGIAFEDADGRLRGGPGDQAKAFLISGGG